MKEVSKETYIELMRTADWCDKQANEEDSHKIPFPTETSGFGDLDYNREEHERAAFNSQNRGGNFRYVAEAIRNSYKLKQ